MRRTDFNRRRSPADWTSLIVVLACLPFLPIASPGEVAAGSHASDPPLRPIPLDGFQSGIHHWRKIRDTGRFIQVEPDQPSYRPDQVREIAANILLFQRENGGWPKDYDMAAVLTDGQKEKVRRTHDAADTSYDNGNIHSQVDYLARTYAQANEPGWRIACERGLDFMLRSQYPNGGFPQRYPNAKDFHAHITFNDGVMMGILNVLDDAARGESHFAWLDQARRDRAKDSVRRGIDCILKCQILEDGKRTGWCQQHDERTFEARPGRTFELASICPQETTEIVRFFMRRHDPSPEILEAADSAVAWLRRVRLDGIKVERVKAPRESFLRHDADFDVIVTRSPGAKPTWARHYEIGTDRPVFAGRDGVRKYAMAEIERERRTGTPWYGGWPARLVERDYKAWRNAINRKSPTGGDPRPGT